jgi:hypothetical protein
MLHAAARATERELLLARARCYPGPISQLPDKLAAISDAAAVFSECGFG